MSLSSSVAVFCGSKPGNDPKHMQDAIALGKGLAARNIGLVYGGGRVGLMGAVADTTAAAGGEVTGVIPDFLMRREVGNTEAGMLEVTDSMHSRKRRMFELADAFVTLAGGMGSLDETVEIITWRQLGLHDKPIIVLSRDGFWGDFSSLIGQFVDSGFAYAENADLYQLVGTVDEVFDALATAPRTTVDTKPSQL